MEPRARRGRTGTGIRIAVVAAALGAAGAGLWLARGERDPAVAGSVPGGRILAPLSLARDAASGEEVAPFSGFAVSVETEPPGALVSVDGVARGEAPAFAGVACAPGDRVVVRAEARGRAPAAAETTCRADALVKLTLRLPPARR
jgi:hypothetical protein